MVRHLIACLGCAFCLWIAVPALGGEALKRDEPPAAEALTPQPIEALRQKDRETLSRLAGKSVEPLLVALKHEDASVRTGRSRRWRN